LGYAGTYALKLVVPIGAMPTLVLP